MYCNRRIFRRLCLANLSIHRQLRKRSRARCDSQLLTKAANHARYRNDQGRSKRLFRPFLLMRARQRGRLKDLILDYEVSYTLHYGRPLRSPVRLRNLYLK